VKHGKDDVVELKFNRTASDHEQDLRRCCIAAQYGRAFRETDLLSLGRHATEQFVGESGERRIPAEKGCDVDDAVWPIASPSRSG
jgi:hypothetical protein